MIAYISFTICVSLVIIDQFIKSAVSVYLSKTASITVISGILNLTYTENTGAAFGIMKGQRWFLIGVTAIIILAGIFLILFKKIKSNFAIICITLIISGGIGNLIDRFFLRYVVDYIELKFIPGFAIFNFSDILVVVGTIMLAIYIIFYEKIEKENKKIAPLTIDEILSGDTNG